MLTFKKLKEENGVVTFEQTFPEITSTFTSEELTVAYNTILKKKKETTAQTAFEKVKLDNVISHHPHVLELTDEQANAVAVYYQTKLKYEECLKMEQEVKQRETDFNSDIVKIKEETGFEFVYPKTEEPK